MKNISLVVFALILTLTFTASDIITEKGNTSDTINKCPYLESLQQNHSQLQCPYLDGSVDGSLSCPYLDKNGENQPGCPYFDGKSGIECPYLKEENRETVKEIKYTPLPEGKNT